MYQHLKIKTKLHLQKNRSYLTCINTNLPQHDKDYTVHTWIFLKFNKKL